MAKTPDHAGGHAAHHHAMRPGTDQRHLAAALILIAAFMGCEVVVGVVAHSLALLSDAGHMLTDVGALGLAIVSLRLAGRPSSGGYTYGLKRAEILSALGNGVTLGILALLIVVEAVQRLVDPPAVAGTAVLVVALVGIGVNVLATSVLARANRGSLNIEGSFQHILTDLYAFIGTAVAGGVILATGFRRADPMVSVLVAGLMLCASQGLIRHAMRILLEAAPLGVNPDAIGRALAAHDHVANVHDLHVWEITSGFPALSAHVLVHPRDDCHAIRLELEGLLRTEFKIQHSTLQVDHDNRDQTVRLTPIPRIR